ncbi:Z1 domain-containing protein [Pontibacter roseus]|uniref:Z1 domain-containing protein n=1 Tax=Pontibacter roseus TaxID=336989 RepID=UPI00037BF2BC|nr:Z1 domain-containing protein [Pontibacter roseus]
MEEIKILGAVEKKGADHIWEVSIGQQARELAKRQQNLDEDERQTVLSEAAKLLEKCANPNGGSCASTGLAIGYVQSGKTLSFTTLTALAKDNGYRIVAVLAGSGNNLLDQTTDRLKKDLLVEGENNRAYKIFSNPDIAKGDHRTIARALTLKDKPLIIITLLKHYKRIDNVWTALESSEVKAALEHNAVLIIDDEADQASLNTMAWKNSKSDDWEEDEYSKTYSSISRLRAALINHSYVQYTATPQAPLLISMMDLMSPDFHVILTPGKQYTGGKAFFKESRDAVCIIPEEEVFHFKHNNLIDPPESLLKALRCYFIGAAIQVRLLCKKNFVSMMVHADREKDASRKFNSWIESILESWIAAFSQPGNDPMKVELLFSFRQDFAEFSRNPAFSHIVFEELMEEVIEVLKDTNIELVIENNNSIHWSNSSSHILIGADKLNRGFTVENLMVTYMPRYSIGKSNADTIQQRCRFFGYKKKYLNTCKVFLPENSKIEYEQYIEHEEALRKILSKQSLQEFSRQMILDGSMNPTRNNVLSKSLVRNKMKGWRQFNAIGHAGVNKDYVNSFIEQLECEFYSFKEEVEYSSDTEDRTHRIAKVPLVELIQFISDFKLTNVADILRKSATIQYLTYWLDNGITQCSVVQMAYNNKTGRERKLLDNSGVLMINNIWSGKDTRGSAVYPGDKEIKAGDEITLQLHLVKLKHLGSNHHNKTIYTLGLFYPEHLALEFVGQDEE